MSWRGGWEVGQSPESSGPFVRREPGKLSIVRSAGAPGRPEVVSQLLTRSQVAALLGVSPNTVTRWARERWLSCQVTLGGHHRFDRGLVERLLRDSTGREAGPADSDGAA